MNDVAKTAITYDIGTGRAARTNIGETASIVIDPEARRVYAYARVGSGVPEKVYNRVHKMFGIAGDVALEDVEKVLRENEAALETIFEAFIGAVWNGSRQVGKWVGEDDYTFVVDDAIEAIEADLEGLPNYWEAGDWLAGDLKGVDNALLAANDAGSADPVAVCVVAEIANAKGEALLDEADVRKVLTERFENLMKEREEVVEWHVPPSCQGQAVERAYGTDDEGVGFVRVTDRSEQTVRVQRLGEVTESWDPENTVPRGGYSYTSPAGRLL